MLHTRQQDALAWLSKAAFRKTNRIRHIYGWNAASCLCDPLRTHCTGVQVAVEGVSEMDAEVEYTFNEHASYLQDLVIFSARKVELE